MNNPLGQHGGGAVGLRAAQALAAGTGPHGANGGGSPSGGVAAIAADGAGGGAAVDPLSQSAAETWLSIASLAETLGDADRAAMAYDATLQYNPSSTKALTSLAHLYRSRDVFQRAAELYQRALAVNPELGDVWATLGHCYLMLDDLQRAYAAYQQALYHLSNPNVPKLWHGIGILYDRYGSLDYAEEAFAKVLELDPHFEKVNEIYFRLGIIYKHQGKWNQALECFRYILPQPPAPLQEWDVWFQLGSVLESMGEWQGAREAYEHVLSQNDRHAKVLQQLGCLYGMNNVQFYDPQTALNLLLKSLEADSTDATTWYHLGRIHMVRNDYTAAYDAFQQAVNRDSRNPTFWCSIGVLYYQISQYRDALDAYTRAIRLNPYISEVWYDLGTLYETCNNQLSDALDAYKQAVRLDPNNVHIRERLEALTAQLANPGAQQPQQQPQQQQMQQPRGPAPIMLQPTLQQQDQTNPLNNKPAFYRSSPHGVAVAGTESAGHTPMSGRPQPLQQLNNNGSILEPSLLPQKRPMEGGMDTLVNAISQQELQQHQKKHMPSQNHPSLALATGQPQQLPPDAAPIIPPEKKGAPLPQFQKTEPEHAAKRLKHEQNNVEEQPVRSRTIPSITHPASMDHSGPGDQSHILSGPSVHATHVLPPVAVAAKGSERSQPVANGSTIKDLHATNTLPPVTGPIVNSDKLGSKAPPDTSKEPAHATAQAGFHDKVSPGQPDAGEKPKDSREVKSANTASTGAPVRNLPPLATAASPECSSTHTEISAAPSESITAAASENLEDQEPNLKTNSASSAVDLAERQKSSTEVATDYHPAAETAPTASNKLRSTDPPAPPDLHQPPAAESAEPTAIKPSADAIEKLQEEARMRQEEELEALQKKAAHNGVGTSTDLPKESVIRKVEEDENYDD
ncbi:FADL344Wp [Eremothecium gossypii FDAG1]|nr:FADL344Wp [Eremothecium gossypii FDAG1]